jgi:hypothetical protein
MKIKPRVTLAQMMGLVAFVLYAASAVGKARDVAMRRSA